MARMIPLYSVSSQAEIERRAREFFEQVGRPADRDLDIWLRAEADYLRVSHNDQNSPGQAACQSALSPGN